ncbi:MAG: 30S ribosomal protein S4 [Candidatus Methanomethylicia archaeon]|jgi:small subunit ribosomal protein S4|nr:30S ribosomal protein S4 [Candidatus Methanomethylicia archaeon]MCQ5374869.1 30S ribosomal protein S4 [Candidatus Methanomethylicia archaeon]NHV60046.1 30S ribosomal protein S4 [Candidatus Verstraetearchaeota archaeon]
MGDPKKSRRRWEGPRHPWKKENLEKELALVGKYGLRNKKELWVANSLLRTYREQATSILGLEESERIKKERELIKKLSRLGLLDENAVLDDVLGLSIEDILERRLQTMLVKLNLAKTPYQARQLIVHGHVYIGDRRVSAPGYLVTKEEESMIKCEAVVPVEAQVKKV